jgi:hypothetical protein
MRSHSAHRLAADTGIASVPVGGSLHYRRSLAQSRRFQGEATGFLDAYS